nr:MAG TPA: hypothetical protein [Caudoviricetes sp.]
MFPLFRCSRDTACIHLRTHHLISKFQILLPILSTSSLSFCRVSKSRRIKFKIISLSLYGKSV